MRVKLCRLVDLNVGDEFFNVNVVNDRYGNVYLSDSKFLITEIKKKNYKVLDKIDTTISQLILHDEEGRDIEHLTDRDFGPIYKGFGSNSFSSNSEAFISH